MSNPLFAVGGYLAGTPGGIFGSALGSAAQDLHAALVGAKASPDLAGMTQAAASEALLERIMRRFK